MKDIDSARQLARTLVDLGRDAGVATRALLSRYVRVPWGARSATRSRSRSLSKSWPVVVPLTSLS